MGNWQFKATSDNTGTRPFTIAGSLSQSGGSMGQNGPAVTGTFHVDGSNCFDRLITRGFTGSLTGVSTSLTVMGTDGQVVTITGDFGHDEYYYGTVVTDTFNGSYTINGGCASGDHGTITGSYIDSVARASDPTTLNGTFSNSSGQQIFHVTGNIVQSASVSPEGSFAFTGTAAFDLPCLGAGTIKPGSYPSASFILGTSVGLEFDTSNGILTLLGTLNPGKREIVGNYTVSGGSCNDSGTAVLSLSSAGLGYWDYLRHSLARVQTQLIKARMPRRQRGTGLRSSSERVCRSALRCA
jgi:hypothetical protein